MADGNGADWNNEAGTQALLKMLRMRMEFSLGALRMMIIRLSGGLKYKHLQPSYKLPFRNYLHAAERLQAQLVSFMNFETFKMSDMGYVQTLINYSTPLTKEIESFINEYRNFIDGFELVSRKDVFVCDKEGNEIECEVPVIPGVMSVSGINQDPSKATPATEFVKLLAPTQTSYRFETEEVKEGEERKNKFTLFILEKGQCGNCLQMDQHVGKCKRPMKCFLCHQKGLDGPETHHKSEECKFHICSNCRKPSHGPKKCPLLGIRCWKCLQTGHYHHECPNAGKEGVKCLMCDGYGHFLDECDIECANCHTEGHIHTYCSVPPCLLCTGDGRFNHGTLDCFNHNHRKDKPCKTCGNKEHIAKECKLKWYTCKPCRQCGSKLHPTNKCPPYCKKCHQHHGLNQCKGDRNRCRVCWMHHGRFAECPKMKDSIRHYVPTCGLCANNKHTFSECPLYKEPIPYCAKCEGYHLRGIQCAVAFYLYQRFPEVPQYYESQRQHRNFFNESYHQQGSSSSNFQSSFQQRSSRMSQSAFPSSSFSQNQQPIAVVAPSSSRSNFQSSQPYQRSSRYEASSKNQLRDPYCRICRNYHLDNVSCEIAADFRHRGITSANAGRYLSNLERERERGIVVENAARQSRQEPARRTNARNHSSPPRLTDHHSSHRSSSHSPKESRSRRSSELGRNRDESHRSPELKKPRSPAQRREAVDTRNENDPNDLPICKKCGARHIPRNARDCQVAWGAAQCRVCKTWHANGSFGCKK